MKVSRLAFVLSACLVLVPTSLFADNTTAATAARLTIGQAPVAATVGEGQERWYTMVGKVGRSYCVSVTTGETEQDLTNPTVSIFDSAGTTLIATNDNIGTEPDAEFQSRACFVLPAGTTASQRIRVTQSSGSPNTYFLYIVESTMFCPWFYADPNYNSWSLTRNTTDAAISATFTWRSVAGTVLATTTLSVPAHGAVVPEVKEFLGAAGGSGTIDVAHNGSPEALVSNQTSISIPAGVSFDTPFETVRRAW